MPIIWMIFPFVILSKALSCMVSAATSANVIGGIRPAPSGPSISHLRFADDTILFCDAIEDQLKNVKAIPPVLRSCLGP